MSADRVLAPAPANEAALNVSTGAQSSSTSPHRVELLGAPQGEPQLQTNPLFKPDAFVLSELVTCCPTYLVLHIRDDLFHRLEGTRSSGSYFFDDL